MRYEKIFVLWIKLCYMRSGTLMPSREVAVRTTRAVASLNVRRKERTASSVSRSMLQSW